MFLTGIVDALGHASSDYEPAVGDPLSCSLRDLMTVDVIYSNISAITLYPRSACNVQNLQCTPPDSGTTPLAP